MAKVDTKSVTVEYLVTLTVPEVLAVLASLRYRQEKVTSHKRSASYGEETAIVINVLERAIQHG